jgi:hypothetical protein
MSRTPYHGSPFTHQTPPASGPRSPRWRWPDPASRIGALFSAVAGGLVVWLLVDVLPHHVHVVVFFH